MSSEEYTNKLAEILRARSASQLATTPPTGMGALAGMFGRIEAKGLYYKGKTIYLEGYRFVECRFDNCVLVANSSNFDLIDCILDDTTQVNYSAHLSKIFQLFLGRYDWAYKFFPEFFLPVRKQDGSLTTVDRG